MAQIGVSDGARRGDRDETRDRARGGADRGGLAVLDLLDHEPGEQRGGGSGDRVDERERGGAVGGELRTGVEAEPAEPQQAGAEEHERRVVRDVHALLEAEALAEHERERERRGTGVDVDRGAAGEVDRADAEPLLHAVGDPAAVGEAAVLGEAEVEHPAGDREVDDRRPDGGEDHPRAELGAVGDRARHEGDREDGERGLEGDEGQRRVGGALRNLEQARQADRRPVDRPRGDESVGARERDGVAVDDPEHADEPQCAEAQHHHADDALGLDQAAVEERETGRHQQARARPR